MNFQFFKVVLIAWQHFLMFNHFFFQNLQSHRCFVNKPGKVLAGKFKFFVKILIKTEEETSCSKGQTVKIWVVFNSSFII